MKNRTPEIWNPETGKMRVAEVYVANKSRTTMPMRLSPLGSIFIIFQKSKEQKHITTFWKDPKLIFPSTNRKGEMALAGN